jgi:phosphatidylglycerophosphate synthase
MKTIKERTKNWWRKNLANLITVIGVISAFLFLRAIAIEPENIKKQIIYAFITAITDFVDGIIARKTNSVSVFGSYIDRIRDRLFIYPGIIILGWHHQKKIPFLELLVCLMVSLAFFEILIFKIGAIGYYWHRRGKDINLQPNRFGKKKMFAGFSVILVWLVSLLFECQNIPILKYSIWLIYFGLCLMVYWSYVSWQEYAHRELNLRKTNSEKKYP